MTKRSKPVSHASSGSPAAGGVARALSTLGTLSVWALVLAVPVVIAPTALDSFRLPKRMLAEWLGLASLVAFALSSALAPASGTGERPPWRRGAFLAVAPLTLVASLGLLVSAHPEHVRAALPDLWIGAACLVGWSVALRSDRLERLLAGLAIPGTFLSALAILQFHDLYRPFAFTRGEETARLGVTSLGGNAGDLAAFLVLPVLIAQWRLAGAGAGARSRPKGRRLGATVLWAVVLVICLYGLAVTQTLTALAAVVLGSALFWVTRLPRRTALAAVGGAAVLAAALALGVTPLRGRIASGVEALREGRVNQALSGRLDGWRAAWWMVEEHPLVGVGQGAYRAEFAPAKLALVERGVPFYRAHVDPFFANAHNEILEVGAEWGILGWLALGWGLWALGRAASRGFRLRGDGSAADPRGAADRALVVGAVSALAVLSIGQFPFRIALAAYPALLLLAWIFRRADDRARDQVRDPARDETLERAGAVSGWFGRLLAWGVALLLVAALVGQTGRWSDRLGASKRLRVVQAVTERAVAAGGRVPAQVISGSLRLLHQAERLDPGEVAVRAEIAGQYLLAGTPHRAEEAYRKALELEPRPELYLNLGRSLLRTGDRDGAIEAFENAVRLAPRLLREVPETMRPAIHRATRPAKSARS